MAVGKRRDGTRLAATGRDWFEPGQMTEMESGNSGAGVVNAPGGQADGRQMVGRVAASLGSGTRGRTREDTGNFLDGVMTT